MVLVRRWLKDREKIFNKADIETRKLHSGPALKYKDEEIALVKFVEGDSSILQSVYPNNETKTVDSWTYSAMYRNQLAFRRRPVISTECLKRRWQLSKLILSIIILN